MMDRKELRNARQGKETAAGSVVRELRELHKLQESSQMNGIETITMVSLIRSDTEYNEGDVTAHSPFFPL